LPVFQCASYHMVSHHICKASAHTPQTSLLTWDDAMGLALRARRLLCGCWTVQCVCVLGDDSTEAFVELVSMRVGVATTARCDIWHPPPPPAAAAAVATRTTTVRCTADRLRRPVSSVSSACRWSLSQISRRNLHCVQGWLKPKNADIRHFATFSTFKQNLKTFFYLMRRADIRIYVLYCILGFILYSSFTLLTFRFYC